MSSQLAPSVSRFLYHYLSMDLLSVEMTHVLWAVVLRHLSEEEVKPAQKLSNLRDGLFRSSLVEDDMNRILLE